MAIKYSPGVGSLLLCDFRGAVAPEMDKKRPVVILADVSPRLCVVAPLSTTVPRIPKPWHYLLRTPEPLPAPYDALEHWVKGDLVCAVSYDRLTLPFRGKDVNGNRIYDIKSIAENDLDAIRKCVANVICPSLLVDTKQE